VLRIAEIVILKVKPIPHEKNAILLHQSFSAGIPKQACGILLSTQIL